MSNIIEQERVIEALLFSSQDPVSIKRLVNILPENSEVDTIIANLQKKYEGRGINIKRSGASISFRTYG